MKTLILLCCSMFVVGSTAADGIFTLCLTQDTLDEQATRATPGDTEPNKSVLRVGRIEGGTWRTGSVGTREDALYIVAFKKPMAVGTVVVYGKWDVSYLKPKGDPDSARDDQWIAAAYPGDVSRNLRVVPLPTGVMTRAIRLAGKTRPDNSGQFKADLHLATAFEQRFINVAPLANISVSSSGAAPQGFEPEPRQNRPSSLLDGTVTNRNWRIAKREEAISPEQPEWIVLDWGRARTLRGCALFTGVSEPAVGELLVQEYTGADRPDGRRKENWRTIKTLKPAPFRPAMFWETYCDFGRAIETRALRFQIVRGRDDSPKAAALGEVMVFEHLEAAPAPKTLAGQEAAPDGVVPITFTMPKDGRATIQILNEKGEVVKNLINGEDFPAGENTVWWDLGTVYDYWNPYKRPQNFWAGPDMPKVASPGKYRWRGLWHTGLSLHYLYSYYPLKKHGLAWTTADNTGGWLADHVPPQTVVRIGDTMYCGTFCEAGQALLQSDLDMKKLWGSGRIWLACPRVIAADGEYLYYVEQGGWVKNRVVMIQVNQKTKRSRRLMVEEFVDPKKYSSDSEAYLSDRKGKWDVQGLAVVGNHAYLSNRAENVILVIDLTKNLAGPWRGFSWKGVGQIFDNEAMTVIKTIKLDRPGRIRPYDDGRVAAVAGDRVVLINTETYEVNTAVAGLENPLGLGIDERGGFYVGEMAPVHQVKVFDAAGKLVRTIGKPGPHRIGKFDPDNLEGPSGVDIDAKGNVWVCEFNEELKRTSVWDAQGRCINQVLGPPTYGGGGTIDPADANRSFYRCKEFRRDPKTGEIRMTHILFRGDDKTYPSWGSYPSYAFRNNGKLFFTSWQGWGGGGNCTLWAYDRDHVRPVASVGKTPDWLNKLMGRDAVFTEKVLQRIEPVIDLTWKESPAPGLRKDGFAIRWSGKVIIPREGSYSFIGSSRESVRLMVDGKEIITPKRRAVEQTGKVELTAGGHDIVLECTGGGDGSMKLEWEGPELPRQVVPASALRASAADNAPQGLTGTYYNSNPDVIDPVFAWTDLNDDGKVQPNEIRSGKITYDGKPWKKVQVTWQFRMNKNFELATSDGSYGAAGIAFFSVERLTPQGYPVYKLPTEFRLFPHSNHASDAVYTDLKGNAISLDSYVFSMKPDGTVNWLYKNNWPGLHAGHHTGASGDEPGVLVAPTRFHGSGVVNDEIGEVICIGCNLGMTHFFTADGLYIDRVFQDARRGLSWRMNSPPSDEVMDHLSLGGEHFGGTFQHVKDENGKYHFRYVVGQPHSSVVELTGLENIRRLPGGELTVTGKHLSQAELLRQQRAYYQTEPKRYTIRRLRNVVIDGADDEWPEKRIDGFALGYDDKNLYVYFEGRDRRAVFENAAKEDSALEAFKTGDVVDVKLQTKAGLDPRRSRAGEGDIRLSFAPVDGKPAAILYDYVVPGTPKNARLPFASPWRTLYVDRVLVLDEARIAVKRKGDRFTLEAAVPLASIHLDPAATPTIRGDVGRVLSDQTGTRAMDRIYWSNKNTKIISDLPSEAQLQPSLWGTFRFEQAE